MRTFEEQAQRIRDLEAMIDVAVGYIKAGSPGLAAIVLIGSKPDGFQALQDAEREAASTKVSERET